MFDQTFYGLIPPINNILGITNPAHYYDVPEDWHIALTDVRGSTKAIEQGKYREVNSIAAASITALLNHVQGVDLPFVFGGDGATILIPPEIVQAAAESLLATRKMARESFDLELRVGIVPVKDVLRDGYRIQIARLKMSDNFQQAIFTGGGISYAEKLLKQHEDRYGLQGEGEYEADFTGFECRWSEIPSSYDETLSLLITAVHPDSQLHNGIYEEVLHEIERIYGDSQKRHPLSIRNLRLKLMPKAFEIEAKIRNRDVSFRRLFKMAYTTFVARIAMWLDIQNWGAYKQLLVTATDHEKFDDTLRMTISGTVEQRQRLREYLEQERQAGKLVYGIHTSKHALVTCIVYDYFGRQVHFVDGSNGGYAYAAKELKAQLSQVGQPV